MNNIKLELNEALEKIQNRTNEVTSRDGIVTLIFTSAGEYTGLKINAKLNDLTTDMLEDSFLDAMSLAKSKMARDFYDIISLTIREMKNNNSKGDSGLEVEVKDVS